MNVDSHFYKNLSDVEKTLLDLGYEAFVFNTKSMKYERPVKHRLSYLANMDHRFFHKNDPIIKKIDAGGIIGKDIMREDRSGERIFGIHEHNVKPYLK